MLIRMINYDYNCTKKTQLVTFIQTAYFNKIYG